MKPKKIKKLSLQKETIARLDRIEQQKAQGGRIDIIFITIASPYTCMCSYNTEPWTCCCDPNDPFDTLDGC